jgi:hypothetical protein
MPVFLDQHHALVETSARESSVASVASGGTTTAAQLLLLRMASAQIERAAS